MTNSVFWPLALQLALKAGWSDDEISAHLHELVKAVDLLGEGYTENVFESYLFGGNAALSGARPIDAIRLGNSDDVLTVIGANVNGEYV